MMMQMMMQVNLFISYEELSKLNVEQFDADAELVLDLRDRRISSI